MSCGSKGQRFDGTIWCNPYSVADVFVPISPTMETAPIGGVKVNVFASNATGPNLRYKRGYQTSEDGETWDAAADLEGSSWLTPSGWSYGSAFVSTGVSKRYVRFGLFTSQVTSGSDTEQALVQFYLDTYPR